MIADSSGHQLAVCANNAPGRSVCIAAGCHYQPFMCAESKCDCHREHQHHQHQKLAGFLARVGSTYKFEKQLRADQQAFEEMLHTVEDELKSIKRLHNLMLTEHLSSELKYGELRQKLLAGEKVNATGLSGDSIAAMLQEL